MRFRSFYLVLTTCFVGAPAGAAKIQPQLNPRLCLDVAGGEPINGTHIQLANCSGNGAQAWARAGETLQALAKCLEVRNGSQTPGATVQLSDCVKDAPNQKWQLEKTHIQWTGTNLCIDIPHGQAVDGQPLQVWTCNADNKNQMFLPGLTDASPIHQAAPDKASTPQPAAPEAAKPVSTPAPAPVAAAPLAQSSSSLAPTTPTPQGGRTMHFVNSCRETVWVAGLSNGDKPALEGESSGFELKAGASRNVGLSTTWGGRFWGRTGCVVSGSSRTVCETGDCGNQLRCNGIGGQPTSLAEFQFDGWAGDGGVQDYYDISHVDAFNLGIKIAPSGGSGACYVPSCHVDVNQRCPADLQVKNSSGAVVACLSSCTKYGTDETCCKGAHDKPATCPAPPGARVVKNACPDAYSYAYDDGTSTWNCAKPTGYTITFCP